MFVTKHSLGFLEECLNLINKVPDNNINSFFNLHVHIPTNMIVLNNEKVFKNTSKRAEKNLKEYEGHAYDIINYLMYVWRPNRLKDNFNDNFGFDEFDFKYFYHAYKTSDNLPGLLMKLGNNFSLKFNGEFRTAEYRGMITDLNYPSLMKNVFLISLLHNLLINGNPNEYLLKNYRSILPFL